MNTWFSKERFVGFMAASACVAFTVGTAWITIHAQEQELAQCYDQTTLKLVNPKVLPNVECDAYVQCEPLCSCCPIQTNCPGVGVAPRRKTVIAWAIGTCDPRPHGQCTACPSGALWRCHIAKAYAGLMNGNCAGPCATNVAFYVDGCRS